MTVSTVPIWVVDVVGSVMMIVLSLLCLRFAHRLRRRDKTNVIWTYLLWVCYTLTLFAVSRSAGHILKQILQLTGNASIWVSIRPVSGALNSFSFMVVASVTLFFQQTWSIYRGISSDKQALQSTRDELLYVNQNLEDLVTERTRELTVSEHKYRRIFELSKDMILVIRSDGQIVDLNPIGFSMLGLDSGGYPDLSKLAFQSFLSRISDWDRIMAVIAEEGSISNAEIDLRRADGANIRSLLTGTLDRGPTPAENTIHFLIKDIERRRLMEQQMAQADKLASVGEFSAGIAHEINNPLGIILGYTQLLLRNEPSKTESFSDLKTIEKHARNCKAIVADLLNFSRSSAPEKEMVSVHDVIDDVVDFIQQHARAKHISIEKSYDENLPRLIMDEKKMRQVFMNLVMNARHAVGDDGAIQITTLFEKRLGQATVRIADTGYGIDNKNISRIFDPFFTTKPTGKGTGLGLSVSYGIIKSHGGRIDVESTPGEGSIFTVTLPADSGHMRKSA